MKYSKKRNGKFIFVIIAIFVALGVWRYFQMSEDKDNNTFNSISGDASVIKYADGEYPSAESVLNFESFQENGEKTENTQSETETESQTDDTQVRAVWLSYLDIEDMLCKKSKKEFENNISAAFDKIAEMGLNTVFAQVRPFSDALYPSEIFPFSYICTGTQGEDPGFDPLLIMVNEAHERNLKIEAWVNPFRVQLDSSKTLSDDNPAKAMLEEGAGDVKEYNGGIYYNPASQKARQLIADGISEIIENYDVDGIHFDDYFYPTKDEAFDAQEYEQYVNDGGELSLGDFRRENINKLVSLVYETIKAHDKTILFGISPQGNLKNNYDGQFIDIEKWLSEDGYIDYLCPQIYYGFNNSSLPYEQTVLSFKELAEKGNVKLYTGLAAYKIGQEDKWAGTSGKDEWKTAENILSRQVSYAESEGYDGFALFRYESMFSDGISQQMQSEKESLKNFISGQ